MSAILAAQSPPFAVKNMMINLKYKKCHVSINGDYYQITFDDDHPEPDNYDDIDEIINSIEPYFLVQCNFEFPEKECHIESDDENLTGHYTDEEQKDLINASKDMFLNVLQVND